MSPSLHSLPICPVIARPVVPAVAIHLTGLLRRALRASPRNDKSGHSPQGHRLGLFRLLLALSLSSGFAVGDAAAQAASSSLKGPPKAAAPAAKAPAAKAAPAQAPTQLTESLKKVATRYARTEERIAILVGRRQKPEPLPASLPNPFYRGVESSELPTIAEKPVEEAPAAPDISDADTLARVAPTLRLGGFVVRNQQPHLTINSTICKVGDVIPVPGKNKDSPIFIQVRKITTDALTLGLNDAELTLPLKR